MQFFLSLYVDCITPKTSNLTESRLNKRVQTNANKQLVLTKMVSSVLIKASGLFAFIRNRLISFQFIRCTFTRSARLACFIRITRYVHGTYARTSNLRLKRACHVNRLIVRIPRTRLCGWVRFAVPSSVPCRAVPCRAATLGIVLCHKI